MDKLHGFFFLVLLSSRKKDGRTWFPVAHTVEKREGGVPKQALQG